MLCRGRRRAEKLSWNVELGMGMIRDGMEVRAEVAP